LEFRTGLHDIYHEAFGGGDEYDSFSEATQFSSDWGWYATIDELARGDITKYEEIENMNVHKCLNNLCYKISKRKKENNELKKAQKNGR
jgi:hypothetical protein